MLNSRGLDQHAKKPLQKVVSFGIGFVAIAVAFGMAGFGSFLTALATIAAPATLAIGFAGSGLDEAVEQLPDGVDGLVVVCVRVHRPEPEAVGGTDAAREDVQEPEHGLDVGVHQELTDGV